MSEAERLAGALAATADRIGPLLGPITSAARQLRAEVVRLERMQDAHAGVVQLAVDDLESALRRLDTARAGIRRRAMLLRS